MMHKLLLIWLATALNVACALKPGDTFELECPGSVKYSVHNVRTYAVVLINAQRNMEITLAY